MRKWFALAVLIACGGGGDGPGGGAVVIEEEGTGPESVEDLLPLHAGSVFGPRSAVVRAPVEIAPGRVAHRYIAQPDTLGSSPSAEAQSELWLERDADGIWFAGSAGEGLLETPILLVPSTARLGMRWRTGSGDTARTYEVIARDELLSPLGQTVFWTIEQQTEVPIYRIYAEGWGLVSLGPDISIRPESLGFYAPLRALSGSDEPAQPQGQSLALEPALDGSSASLPDRFDSLRAVRLQDGEVRINFVGATKNTVTPPVLRLQANNLSYRDGVITQVATIFPSSADVTEIPPTLPGMRSYEFGPDGFFSIGNVLHAGGRVFYSTEDLLIYENELGGVSAAAVSGLRKSVPYRFELPLIDPGYGPENGMSDRPIWGSFFGLASRILIGDNATRETVPFAHVSGSMGQLWSTQLRSLAYGRTLDEARFVEAFPDAMGTDLTSRRGALISTTSSAGGRVHLFTTPGGTIDRIEVDGTGARRSRIGRVELPTGHVLRGAIDPGDGALVVFTYEPLTQTAHVWTTRAAAPTPIDPAPFVTLEWTQWDARVCWPPSAQPLDSSDWRLGPAPAAAVVPISDNCALVIRDLEATPIPNETFETLPLGWGVFEGDVPGAGHVRAFEAGGLYGSMPAPVDGAWLRGGGAVTPFAPDNDTRFGLEFSSGGIPRGTAVGLERLSGTPPPVMLPDPSGAGLWAVTPSAVYPDSCGSPCVPETTWGITLGGPEPVFFPTLEMYGSPIFPVRTGGVVVARGRLTASEHRGPIHLRPDGTFIEISLPDIYRMDGTSQVIAVRESGEVCGTGLEPVGLEQRVWCSQPDGTSLRQAAPGNVAAVGGLIDDRTLLVLSGTEAKLLDLETLSMVPYTRGTFGALTTGADGLLYGTFIAPDGARSLGAFTAGGFVPLRDIYDSGADDPLSIFVMEDFVTITFELYTIRVPRDRWNPSSECVPTTAPNLDADGDGFVAATSCGDDCDDGDGDVNPSVVDVCGDSVDNDCDGIVDSGGPCWEDRDEDTFAPSGAADMNACDCPAGWTAREPVGDAVDCNDGDARMFPGQTEYFVEGALGVPASFDFNCDGAETKLYPAGGSCAPDGMMGCDITAGMLTDVACGSGGQYVGCAEPSRCGACDWGIDVFSGTMGCVIAPVILTQPCR